MRYLMIIERDKRNLSAYLPGCVATGKDLAELKKNMHVATELHVRGLREDDLPIPEPSTQAEFVEIAA